jgi:hypothetical protein
MMKLLTLSLLIASTALAQITVKPVTVCWTPEGGEQTCTTFQPGQTAMITVDLRMNPVPAVVVQPLPAYQIKAMQQIVDAQTYVMQKADNTFETKQRYHSVQDLYVQYIIRQIMVPALKQFPATGDDAGKQTYDQLKADLISGLIFFPAF